jgi:predicted LPLAT superfamily acyltransferase
VSDRPWRGRSRGGSAGHALVFLAGRLLGRTGCHCFIVPPVLWLLAQDHAARAATIAYWQRLRPGLGRWGLLLRSFLHWWSFGRRLADRLLIRALPGAYRFTSRTEDRLRAGMMDARGCVLLSAHIGAWDVAGRWLAQYPSRGINLVLVGGEDPRIQAQLDQAMGDRPYRVIDPTDAVRAGLEIAARLRAGEVVCMLGDRTASDGSSTRHARLLGANAPFPIGPFVAAAATGAPLIATFCVNSEAGRYHAVAYGPFRVDLGNRRERPARLQAWVDRWARQVEAVARRYPDQWSNFFDLWAGSATTDVVGDRRAPPPT